MKLNGVKEEGGVRRKDSCKEQSALNLNLEIILD